MKDARSAHSAPLAVVLNPSAGRGQALRAWPRLERELHARRYDFSVIMSTSADDALQQVRKLPTAHTVVAVGGDGTVRALLPAVLHSGRALAIVPLGSGNDFAGMLGLRNADFRKALGRLERPPQRVDALWVDAGGGRELILNGLGMGFDALVASFTRSAPARLNGFGRYAWSALRSIRELYCHDVEVKLDGAVMYQGSSALVAVMNGCRYGGGFRISPESDPRDGFLDVVLGTRVTRSQLLPLMNAVTRGAHLDDPRVRCGRGREVTLTWAQPTHAHFDGDVSGLLQRVSAGVHPGGVLLH